MINFDVPATVDAFSHRIGRTGRASRTGEAFTFAGRDDRKIINQIERTLGKKMLRVNDRDLTVEIPERTPVAEQPGKKSWHKGKKNGRPAGRGNGRPAARAAKPAVGEKQETPPARHRKAGSRQKRRRRAAMLDSGFGNLFLNP